MIYNKIKISTRTLLLFVALFFSLTSIAQEEFPARPEPPRLVNDFAGVLSAEQVASLENKLVNFYQKTSTQISIVTVKSIFGYDKADYAQKLSEKWGIGQKGKNNGILILVKPKLANERGEVFVAVGYGLEAVVPDAVARQTIVSAELIPAFKQNDYFTGLDKSTDVLISLTSGEFTADQYVKSVKKEGKGGIGGFALIMIILVILFIFKRGGGTSHGIGGSTRGLLGGMLLGSMLGGNHGGSWGGFSGGGGSSGGGFGGFGGGSFGGGGAGGSW
ncbi:MAG TPA: TPM domain-containing protein [Prolixibacteraceae bacterium]|nr:TPM domain-containing protein [Prolixibacteraceae bacterium]